jgi:hypothetical protein
MAKPNKIMSRKHGLLVLCSLALTLSLVLTLRISAASADPTFSYEPANLETPVQNCISEFKTADDLAKTILDQLNDAQITVHYQEGGGETANPSPGSDPTGKPLVVYWDSNLTGLYTDKAPKVPCAVLLHELQHAARYFIGQECTGPTVDENQPVQRYDESMGVRAENWWLSRSGLTQRTSYGQAPLDQWTRWPAPPAKPVPVPSAPPCYRHGCDRFQQADCVDFHGGIYSGGDHRGVANGNLQINIGALGYCSDREPCEFKNCYICPHLDTAFPTGATVTAIATPGKDSTFARWGPGACRGQGPTCTFTAQRPSCISAQFLLTNPTAPPQSLPEAPCPEDP